jgi:hypothetical protein
MASKVYQKAIMFLFFPLLVVIFPDIVGAQSPYDLVTDQGEVIAYQDSPLVATN